MGKNKDEESSKKEKEKDTKDKGDKEKKDKGEKKKSPEKVIAKITSLERKLETLKASTKDALAGKYTATLFGVDIRCDKDVRITVGPIIGKVTSTTAIVLLEVTLTAELVIHLIPRDKSKGAVPVSKKQIAPRNRPKAFLLEGLTPSTIYDVAIEGVNAKDAQQRKGVVRTFGENPSALRIVALSCDRPERLLDGETNMWTKLADQVLAGEVDVVLHLGDQVYGQKEFQDAQALLRYSGHPRGADAADSTKPEVKKLHKEIKNRMRDIYRFTWNLPGTATVLSHVSNLMIWSDNDIYNDFTIAKEEGHDNLEPIMIHLGHQVYREYQRQLHDVDYESDASTNEFHFHKWGPTGVFIHDMRGNRISPKGEQLSKNPIVNEKQWEALTKFVADPEIKNLVVCSEIPFVSNSPEEAKAGAKKAGLEFLEEHWAYHDDELVRLFDLVFNWKNHDKAGRDLVLLGGDIHVGVTTKIKDASSGIEVLQLTTTPISNHVCGFFPKLQGNVNARYSYVHEALKDCRNYAYLVSKFEGGHATIDAKLIAGAPIHHEKK